MKHLLLIALSLASGNAFAAPRDCSKTAVAVARAVDSISNSTPLKAYRLDSAKKIKVVPSGGETLDTYLVHMVVNEDMATIWQVDVYSSQCVVKAARFLRGD